MEPASTHSQLENDGYKRSATCLKIELNKVIWPDYTPNDKLGKLVEMCREIKEHVDCHLKPSYLSGKVIFFNQIKTLFLGLSELL